ncbi:AAA family ATPase [Enterobacter sp. CC120223-11]|uniref:AAA family ATPase n=1 Tax=Enterobacter sp. CC120223-11 TaxID=1378073 RepID=UPI000BD19D07|nr:AAA family ATPase [Enterobacter sp. CC120223-11]SNY59251.1 Predicted ATPase [Enterobacter sp. CC120223-11]
MISRIQIQNFRSVRKIDLELGRLNVVVGSNGCGKSNIYKGIQLLSAAAEGRFSSHLSDEGGLENVMWSGQFNAAAGEPRRLALSCQADDFDYEMQIGFPDKLPYPTHFALDAVFKEENIWVGKVGRRPSANVLHRKNSAAFLVDVDGHKTAYTDAVYENESIFGHLGEPHKYPEISLVRETMRKWRFYHEFDVSKKSSLRTPSVGHRSPVLFSDGANLAAAFQTIIEIGDAELLTEILADAFPECSFYCENEHSLFAMKMRRKGVLRPLLASEMSDGTLRFLCLAVALLSPRPPSFFALNEPENSLHPLLLPALAKLIVESSRYSQIWLTSHSPELAELIAGHTAFHLYELENGDGETVIKHRS